MKLSFWKRNTSTRKNTGRNVATHRRHHLNLERLEGRLVLAGTVVHFETNFGAFNVELTDAETPQTVANFLDYVNDGSYNNSIIHRSIPGFVIQGGGYTDQFFHIPEHFPVLDEFRPGTNLRGTIAMAKTGFPDSATNQWFFNLQDNSPNLDVNGQFTSFGTVLGNGMNVIDAIAGLPTFNFQGFGIPNGFNFTDMPVRNYTQADHDAFQQPNFNNIVEIFSVTVVPNASTLAITDTTVNEGNAGTTNAVFTVTLSAPSPTPVTVAFGASDGTATAGSDYQGAADILTLLPGETTKTLTVVVFGDTLVEPNEIFSVNLSNPTGATIADGVGLATIVDDDNAPVLPTLAISDAIAAEGNAGISNFVFTLTLSAASPLPVSVSFATSDDTATAGSDYTAASGIVNFAPGVTNATVTVAVLGDTAVETDETFTVVLSNPTDATIADATGLATIFNDDLVPLPVPAISISDVVGIEGNAGVTDFIFTVSLSQPSFTPITVDFATVDGTAAAGSDYFPTGGVLAFAPGETSKNIVVAVLGDTDVEVDELFTIILSNPTDATLLDATGTATIVNDDLPAPVFSGIVNIQIAPQGVAGSLKLLGDGANNGVTIQQAAIANRFILSSPSGTLFKINGAGAALPSATVDGIFGNISVDLQGGDDLLNFVGQLPGLDSIVPGSLFITNAGGNDANRLTDVQVNGNLRVTKKLTANGNTELQITNSSIGGGTLVDNVGAGAGDTTTVIDNSILQGGPMGAFQASLLLKNPIGNNITDVRGNSQFGMGGFVGAQPVVSIQNAGGGSRTTFTGASDVAGPGTTTVYGALQVVNGPALPGTLNIVTFNSMNVLGKVDVQNNGASSTETIAVDVTLGSQAVAAPLGAGGPFSVRNNAGFDLFSMSDSTVPWGLLIDNDFTARGASGWGSITEITASSIGALRNPLETAVRVLGDNGGDTFELSTSTIAALVDLQLRGGLNSAHLASNPTSLAGFKYTGGSGADTVTIDNTRILYRVDIKLYEGNDTLSIRNEDYATQWPSPLLGAVHIDAGLGADTLSGALPPSNLLANFEFVTP